MLIPEGVTVTEITVHVKWYVAEMILTYVSLRHVVVDDSGQWRGARGRRVEAGGGSGRNVVAVRAQGAQVGVPGGGGGSSGRRVATEGEAV